ncbi:PrgI family protein [Paenibacillus alvei]|uniref:PrgI family protein n=1 Tax=Paenibacillus alvei TaxID=44250 RepID=UPI0013D9E188|nr:PrgI family protein [Paenibacillus alvei]NEZ44436.1 hypothetical protein [Paenibacillus alvei]
MEKRKIYHIPRKVNEGIKFLGLGTRQCIIMLIFIAIAAFILFVVPINFDLKIVLCTFIVITPYGLLTLELGNGLIAIEYVKLMLKYFIFDQNVYTLTSARSKEEKERREMKVVVGAKREYSSQLLREKEENVISEWEDNKNSNDEDKEHELESLSAWIAKPKDLSKS